MSENLCGAWRWAGESRRPWARAARVEAPSPPPPEDDGHHPLLTAPAHEPSRLALWRAVSACVYLDIEACPPQVTLDYYERLEKLEETLSPEARKLSRHCELELTLDARTPSSPFFNEHYGHIYRPTPADKRGLAAALAATLDDDTPPSTPPLALPPALPPALSPALPAALPPALPATLPAALPAAQSAALPPTLPPALETERPPRPHTRHPIDM